MLMTAAGTVAPAKVLVLGAGVAGLQAIATARRLGAVVSAFDTRPVVKEQVESLGASFVEIELAVSGAQDSRGYATALTAELSQRLLDGRLFEGGRRFCFLYTDLANPTSNAIYERIGYVRVAESAEIVFG
jgi:predicted GNAT family acetyltransferase